MKTLDFGKLGLGACCLGASKELLEISTIYSKQCRQFGEPISKFQPVEFMSAKMVAKIYPMEIIVYRTAKMYDEKKMFRSK